jgi:hypothetical protein
MWIALTTLNENTCLVDLSKATNIQPIKTGTQIQFSTVAQNAEGKNVARSIIVSEPIDYLARLLKAKR